ncbi:hypothetical protein ACFVVQ_08585 [Paenibacillus chitinolyticus]|uniref:Uncharacterized protein n=1 Tax=Paenibacillus chitinolyticus TaxID=79263 RepID=A0A410WZH3_9BACL|nr:MULTISPECIES: hypothetical protein [Paenibacillus]MCY9590152.1 hypothetical protein [Paenibacillus chitinolyticus]MCY9596848.1 hypothetical protein [Paenibacillus chitinolyticus]QAV19838.1 hypothetical protein PC41400_20120 [Paenibacillus chitinolyticus]GKS09701.1 hypothetical protein YDYSY3_07010 [Paenibacillus chitinolyticus]
MAQNRRLTTDQDFKEAMDRQSPVRVFKNDHIIDTGAVITRFDDSMVVVQTRVSELTYHDRLGCEFFEMRKR